MITRFMSEETYIKIEKAMRDYRIERARQLHDAGYTREEISKILGISISEVRSILY